MVVYVEYVIADNMTFDALVLWASARTLKLCPKKWRILLGAIVGTATAFVSVYLEGWWTILVKTLMLVAMCVAVVGRTKLLLYIITVMAYTFATGGVIVGLFYLFKVEFTYDGALNYNSIPLGLYLLGIIAVICLVGYVKSYISARHSLTNIVDIKVQLGNSVISSQGFVDSGNTLTHDGIAVCFAMNALRSKVIEYMAEMMVRGKCVTVQYNTLTSRQSTVAIPSKVMYRGRWVDVYIALPNNKTNVQYGLLLNGSFSEVENEID